jgi:hypothetical protein
LESVNIIRQAVDSLPKIRDLLRWAHNDGYLASAPNPDRPTHVPPPPLPGAPKGGLDDQPGPTHDIGIGSHPSRTAYGAAVLTLLAADKRLDDATRRLTGGSTRPRELRWDGGVPLTEAVLLSARVRMRLRQFHRHAEHGNLAGEAEADVLRACGLVGQAHDQLTKALNRGPADPAATALEARCRICKAKGVQDTLQCPFCERRARDAARKREKRRKEGKKSRANGVTQRQGVFRSALEAQKRRQARGEGWGDESFGCVEQKWIQGEAS